MNSLVFIRGLKTVKTLFASCNLTIMTSRNLNFCPNLSLMFVNEHDNYGDRFLAAQKFGFKAVEICFPYDVPAEQLKQKAVVETILINSYPGGSGEFGFAALPGSENEIKFKDSMEKTFKYADALQVKRIHIMSGVTNSNFSRDQCYETLEKNLTSTLNELVQRNCVGLIEPINKKTIPGYFLNNYKEALQLVKKINSPNIRLQLDIFHLQQIQGDLTAFIEEALPFVGHIQIAQVPERNEPNANGEINYPYIFHLLLKNNYNGWIGLEYKPSSGTEKGLDWIKSYDFTV